MAETLQEMREPSDVAISLPDSKNAPVFQRHANFRQISSRAIYLWSVVRKNKKRIIIWNSKTAGKSATRDSAGRQISGGFEGLAFSKHGRAKTVCMKKIVLYDPNSDLLRGFDSWAAVLACIQDERLERWWLDSLEPPDCECCLLGTKFQGSDGVPRSIESLVDLTGCDTSAAKLLCPWSNERAWERDDGGKEDRVVFNAKTPRDQFIINESFGNQVMLLSINVPVALNQQLRPFRKASILPTSFNHPIMPHIIQKLGSREFDANRDESVIMNDRSYDMPFIMLRGKNFLVTYGWAPNNLCMNIRTDFVNMRAHLQSLGQSLTDSALDELFAKALEHGVSELESLVDCSTLGADNCDELRQQFTSDDISRQKDSDANEYLKLVADNIVSCNRLIRSMLPKKAVFTALDEIDWPDYICKTCAQRMEASVAVFSYLEARAVSNLEQCKSLQDSFLSMINLSLSNQGMEMNIIMQRFAVVTLIMAPLTLVTGFFGMNALQMPAHHSSSCLQLCASLVRPRHECSYPGSIDESR
jgi:hypothetical protein